MAENKKKWQKALDPYYMALFCLRKLSPFISNDELYLRMKYYLCTRRVLNLSNPQTFNEKIQWLKLYGSKPEYTRMVDKYEAKEYVRSIIGNEHIIPTLGVWNSWDEIDFSKLPDKFVMKTTHDSGSVAVCKDKTEKTLRQAKKKICKSLKKNYFYETREYPYKDVKPRIIAEQYMTEESGKGLKDYKFFCFNGEPKMLFVATDRPFDTRFDFFDMNFNHLNIQQGHPNASKRIDCPKGFEEMKRLAKILSKDICQVRVDFYDIDGKIYFGEMTFSHFGGNTLFEPDKWDSIMGSWITLPKPVNPYK